METPPHPPDKPVEEIDNEKTYAVIAGDVIGSSKLPKDLREKLPEILRRGSENLHAAYPDAVPFPVDVYAGDSWQLFVVQPNLALRAAVYYRAFLLDATKKQADTRMVISLGKIDFLHRERVSESDGEAFRNAGKFLQETTGKQCLNFIAPREPQAAVWNGTFGLLDVIIRHWSAKQARVIAGAINGKSQDELTSLWAPPISQSTIARHMDQAGWQAVEHVFKLFEEYIYNTNRV
jgi:hypothetical protein